mgnify:CR=1 FL=1
MQAVTARTDASHMIHINQPCCDAILATEMPLPDTLRCEDCAVTWTIADPEPEGAQLAA